LRIVCPVCQRIPSRKAHDKLIVRTCAALAQRGAHVILLAPGPIPTARELEDHYALPHAPELEILPISTSPRFLYRARLFAKTRSIAADAIYVSELKVAAHFAKRKDRLRAPLFYEAHTLHGHPRESLVFRIADGVLTTVATLAERIRAAHPGTAPEIAPLASAWAEELEVRPPQAQGALHAGYVGQLYPLQGVGVLLEALALLPEFRLTIVGGKEIEIELQRGAARGLGVEDRVAFKGYVEPSKVRSELAAMDVLLLPSKPSDRMPFVAHTKALEYLAMRRAIVAADLPSIREELGDCALYVAPEDPVSWSAALRRLAEDPELAPRLGDAAFQRARRFTWERRADAMLEAFRRRAPPAR
jgi:glycosyltransferase involved in cell wall biosynthesis